MIYTAIYSFAVGIGIGFLGFGATMIYRGAVIEHPGLLSFGIFFCFFGAMAIALGLGKRVIQETWMENSNCMLDRPDTAIYWTAGACPQIPDHWLI